MPLLVFDLLRREGPNDGLYLLAGELLFAHIIYFRFVIAGGMLGSLGAYLLWADIVAPMLGSKQQRTSIALLLGTMDRHMLERLANTVYWACTASAFLWMAFAFYAESTSPRPEWGTTLLLVAIISVPLWLVGRAVRYVLSGR